MKPSRQEKTPQFRDADAWMSVQVLSCRAFLPPDSRLCTPGSEMHTFSTLARGPSFLVQGLWLTLLIT